MINPELVLQNFKYVEKILCNIWNYDLIFEKHINAKYVKESKNLFKNLQFKSMDKKKVKEMKW